MSCWFILADIHFRQDSLVRNASTFEWIKRSILDEKPSQVIMCGDQTTNRENISWDTLHAFKDLLDSIVSAPWEPTVHLLTGNHDMADWRDRTVNSGSILSVGSPRIIAYSEITQTVIDGCKVLFLPWHADHKEVAAYLASLYPDKESRQDTAVFAHLALGGASTNVSGHVHCGTEITAESFNGFPNTFLGHFHKHKAYGENGSVLYVGSPVQLSFNESGDLDKGYLSYKPSSRKWTLKKNPHAEQFIRLSVAEAQQVVEKKLTTVAGKMVQITGLKDVEKKLIDKVRKGLQDVAKVSGIAPAREAVFPALVNSTEKEVEQQKQASRIEILDYAREYLANRSDWLSEDGDKGVAMLEYVKQKGQQLKRDGLEDGTAGCGANETFIAEVTELQIENFLGVSGKRTFEFDRLKTGVWLVQGKNGAGKTSLIEAIVWCLYGMCTRGENVAKKNVVSQVLHLDAPSCCVTVRFANGLRVTRSRTKAGKVKLWYQFTTNADNNVTKRVEKGTVALTQAMLERVLNVDYTTFINTVLLNASQTQTFAIGGDERKKIIDDLLGFAVLEHYAAAMSVDNTRVNSEIKTCNLAIQSLTGKKDVLESMQQRKAAELDQRKLELLSIAESVAAYATKVNAVEHDDLQSLMRRKASCAASLSAVESCVADATLTYERAVAAYDVELDRRVSSRRAQINRRISELQHLVNKERDDRERVHARHVQVRGLRDQLDRAERSVIARNDLKERVTELETSNHIIRCAFTTASTNADAAKVSAVATQSLVQDLERELARYATAFRQAHDECERVSRLTRDEQHCVMELSRLETEFAAYEDKKSVQNVMKRASSHIDEAVNTLNEAWPEGNDNNDDDNKIKSKLSRPMGAASRVLNDYLQRYDNDGDQGALQDGQQHICLEKQLATLRDELRERCLTDAQSVHEHAKERLANCELRLAAARHKLNEAHDRERTCVSIANAKKSEFAKAETTRGMVQEQYELSMAENHGNMLEIRTLLHELEVHNNDEDNAMDRFDLLQAEITDLEQQVADLPSLQELCEEEVTVAVTKSVVTESFDALMLLRQSHDALVTERNSVEASIAAVTERLHQIRCELERFRERHENVVADIATRDSEVTSLLDDTQQLTFELDGKASDLDKLMYESKVINRWLKVWKGRGTGGDLQATSFRSFCLERNVSLINDRLAVNIDLLNRDMHDESWGQSLSCELDNELRLVETGTGLSFYRMSEGQRKRMQLALFFATFEVAQNRSAFQPRILFLDEVFDALDQDGQIAVQRWIAHYAETHENGKIFVVSHSATTEGLAKNIAGRILVTYGKDGSQYAVREVE